MLINCVAYQDGKRLGEIQPDEIHRYLAMPGCFVWVALLERDPALLEKMRGEFGLHPLAVEDAQNGHQRPKSSRRRASCPRRSPSGESGAASDTS